MQIEGKADDELIAAQPGDDVGAAHDREQPPGGLAQHGVAGVVAVHVVDVLETIEVEEGDGDVLAVALCPGQLSSEKLVEEAAVGESCQRVAQGEGGQVRLQLTQFGHVPADALQTAADGGDLHLPDHDRAVGMAIVEVDPIGQRLAVERPGDCGESVVVDDVDQSAEVLEEVRRRKSEDPFDRRADVVEVREWIGDETPHHVGGSISQFAEPCFALGQVQLGDVAPGDISTDSQDFGPVGRRQVLIDPFHPLTGRVRRPSRARIGEVRRVVVQPGKLRPETTALGFGQEVGEGMTDDIRWADVMP